MWRIIKFLFTGNWKLPCEHNDEIYKEYAMERTQHSGHNEFITNYTAYHLRCTKCGRMSYKELVGTRIEK